MKKNILINSVPLLFLGVSSFAEAAPATQFISYWTSWSQGNNEYQYPNLKDVPDGVNQAFVAFALENDANTALILQLPEGSESVFSQDINSLHQRGIKVVLSTGGAWGNFPWEIAALTDNQIIQQYEQFTDQYHFDGIDFDVETWDSNILRLENIISHLKSDRPNLQISYTVAISSTGIPNNPGDNRGALAEYLVKNHLITYVNIMNYDSMWTPDTCTYTTTDMTTSCYVQNIQAVQLQLQGWGLSADQAKALISNGIMIGEDDSHSMDYAVTLDIAKSLTAWLKQNNYGAVMSWALTRDQPGDNSDLDKYTGLTESQAPAKAFTQAIIGAVRQ